MSCCRAQGILFNIYIPYLGFPGGVSSKGPTCQGRRHKRCGFDSWARKIPWSRHGNPLQYSCLENPTDRGAWGHKESDTTEAA